MWLPQTAIGYELAANNPSHFVVISSQDALFQATQLPDSTR